MQITIKAIILSIATIFTNIALCDTLIYFVNGASNFTSADRYKAQEKLKRILTENNIHSTQKLIYAGIEFSGSPAAADAIFSQQTLSSIAISKTGKIPENQTTADIYLKNLGDLYNSEYPNPKNAQNDPTNYFIAQRVLEMVHGTASILKQKIDQGHKIILVAHSQGNLYTEGVLSLLHSSLGNSLTRRRVQVVNLAADSVLSYNQKWISIEQDQAVNGIKYAILVRDGVFNVLPNSDTACLLPCSSTASLEDLKKYRKDAHGFNEIYSNDEIYSYTKKISLAKLIAKYVQESIDYLDEQDKPIISSFPITIAQPGTPTPFSVNGTNLPNEKLVISSNGCSNFSYVTVSSTVHTFSCTYNQSGATSVRISTLSGIVLGTFNVTVGYAALPIVAFTISPQNPKVDEYVTYTVTQASSQNGNIVSYEWYAGIGTPATFSDGDPKVFKYTAPGTYTVKLTVTDAKGASSSVTNQVIVTSGNQNSISISPLSVTLSKDITFTVTGQNLASGMGFAVDDCSPSSNELPGGTTTQRQFRCTINSTPGIKKGILKDKPGGTNILLNFSVDAQLGKTVNSWISTITPPGYVIKNIINTDLASLPNGNFSATGEYRINFDAISCNLSQTLAITGNRNGNNYTIQTTYTSPQTTCSDGSHTASPGYIEKYTGVLNNGIINLTNIFGCSFTLNTCYNYSTISPQP